MSASARIASCALLVFAAVLLAACGQAPKAPASAAMAPTAAGTPPASSISIGNSFFSFNNGITSHMAHAARTTVNA